MNVFLFFGALFGFLAVGSGAFGSHVLTGMAEPYILEIWGIAVQFLMFHSAALLAIGILKIKFPYSSLLDWSGIFFILGAFLFSGTIFIRSLTELDIGFLTPIGGFSLLTAWVLLVIASVALFRERYFL